MWKCGQNANGKSITNSASVNNARNVYDSNSRRDEKIGGNSFDIRENSAKLGRRMDKGKIRIFYVIDISCFHF